MNATEKDLAEAADIASAYTLEDTRRVRTLPISHQQNYLADAFQIIEAIHKQYHRDPNFPIEIVARIEEFLGMCLSPRHLIKTTRALAS